MEEHVLMFRPVWIVKISKLKSAYASKFLIIFYWLIWKTVKNRKESFLPFVDICIRSRDMSFQGHGNLDEKCEKKIEHFVPL